jgi:ADP-heptose:LPS heptosyltransferase
MAGRLEKAGRRMLVGALTRLLPPREEPSPDHLRDEPSRVLVVRHDDRIGNLILLTPLLAGIREVWQDVVPDVLVGPRFADLYRHHPDIGRVWVLRKRRILRNPLRLMLLLRRIRRRRYDLAFDASHMHSFSLTGAGLTLFSGAPVRVAYDRDEAASFANLLVDPLQADHHEADLLLNLLRPFTEVVPDPPMRLALRTEERHAARSLLQERGVGPDSVVVGAHVGGRDAKRWPVEQWLAVFERILDAYEVELAVFCGPAERTEAARIRAELGSRAHVFEDLAVRELMALVEACSVFLGPDTGAMHMAVALDVPVVAVFLQENWRRYGPRGSVHRTVRVESDGGVEEVSVAFAQVVGARFGTGGAEV